MFNSNFSHSVEDRGFEVVIYVDEYSYYSGRAQQGPTYSCAGEPAEPAEVEVLSGYIALDGCGTGSFQRLFDAHINATDTVFDRLVEAEVDEFTDDLLEYATTAEEEAVTEAAIACYESRQEAYDILS